MQDPVGKRRLTIALQKTNYENIHSLLKSMADDAHLIQLSNNYRLCSHKAIQGY
jgi:hypothetical protein